MSHLKSWFTSFGLGKKNSGQIDDEWRMSDMVSYRQRLARQWLSGEGIEIGALHQPVTLPDGVKARYVDYKTKAENQAHYPELEACDLVNTDIVDDGFILNNVADQSQDFIIANHALEHSPDPYGTLLFWKTKLRPRGMLYFALPIAEKCYDRGRPLTTLEHFLEDHRLFSVADVPRLLATTEGHLREFLRVSGTNIRRDKQPDYIPDEQEIEQLCSDLISALKEAVLQSNQTYDDLITLHVVCINQVYDIHYHTFSPVSLLEFVRYFCEHESCELVEIKKSGGGECIVLLRNQPN
jgi:hypothetical protein